MDAAVKAKVEKLFNPVQLPDVQNLILQLIGV